jgi:hypothetical protein
MSLAGERIDDPEAVKAEWLDRLAALFSLVKGWVEGSGWRTREVTKPVTEPGLGRYEVLLLIMERDEVEIVVSPVARTFPGASGVVDLSLMPAYDDVASLCFEGGQWVIRHAYPPDPMASSSAIEAECLPLDEVALNRVLDAVAAHA